MHFEAIDLEDAADAGLAYLAVAPALDLPALGPELQVNWVACLEHSS